MSTSTFPSRCAAAAPPLDGCCSATTVVSCELPTAATDGVDHTLSIKANASEKNIPRRIAPPSSQAHQRADCSDWCKGDASDVVSGFPPPPKATERLAEGGSRTVIAKVRL